jgi:hypothetical protein
MMKSLFWLIIGTVAVWAAVTYPLRELGQRKNWEHSDLTIVWSTTAALLCLVPTALTLIWTYRAQQGQPVQQLLAMMGGTGVRLFVVVAGGLILYMNFDQYAYQRFWLFLVGYYLFTLALEMFLIVRGTAAGQPQPKN